MQISELHKRFAGASVTVLRLVARSTSADEHDAHALICCAISLETFRELRLTLFWLP